MNVDKNIRLNFYTIIPEEFEFKVWRQEYRGEKREDFSQDLYRNTLPIEQDLNSRRDYWILFEPKADFEEFVCKETYNHKLTQHYLYHLLLHKIKNKLPSEYYMLPSNFRKIAFFVLKKHKEGNETVWLEPYYLKSIGRFGFLVDFRFRKDPDVPYSRYIQQLSFSLDSYFRSNRNFYIDKYQKIQEFLSGFKDKIFPLSSNCDNTKLDISTTFQDLPIRMLKTKKYIFGNEEIGSSQYKGLAAGGPLEELDKRVILAYIFLNRDKYLLEDLKNALRGDSYNVMFKGLKRIFGLEVEKIKEIPISDFSQKSLDYATKKVITLEESSNDVLVMPILIGDKNDNDSYYSMKYKLLKNDLPLQVVTEQLLRKRESLKWATSNIALQIFAKLGGKAWKVLPSHEKSIIFGIGQSHKKESGKIVKYFAYSVCTDSSGIYKKIDILGKSEDEKTYLAQLKTNIIKTIEEHLYEGYTKYVLHIPFKVKGKELEAIYNAVKDFTEERNFSDIEFVVLKINTKNKFFGYAYTNSLVPYES